MKKFFLFGLCTSLLLGFFNVGWASLRPRPLPITPQHYSVSMDAARQLSGLLANIDTMQADFSQTTFAHGNYKKQYGRMFLERPGKFRWNIIRPVRQTIVTDGRDLWYYDADLNQATRKVLDTQQQGSPAMLLVGDLSDLIRDFAVTKISSFGSSVAFKLRPKNTNSMYQEVRLYFKGVRLQEMHITDNLGQKSAIVFRNQLFNHHIYSATFNFIPPVGADVIKN